MKISTQFNSPEYPLAMICNHQVASSKPAVGTKNIKGLQKCKPFSFGPVPTKCQRQLIYSCASLDYKQSHLRYYFAAWLLVDVPGKDGRKSSWFPDWRTAEPFLPHGDMQENVGRPPRPATKPSSRYAGAYRFRLTTIKITVHLYS